MNEAGRAHTLSKYEAVAFVTGFALLAYELTAARILAPSIGSSTYVWTSVIGVIIAALSLGYAAGGIIADRRVKQSDLAWLLLLASGTVLLTLVLADPILESVSAGFKDPRLQGVTVAALLFSPTSFILGIISPYLARLRTVSLETTGISVAWLNAANAIGGIVGTFSVGFIFFGYIGSKESLLFTALLLLLPGFLFVPSRQILRWIGIAFMLFLALSWLSPAIADNQVADIDTPSAHYGVYDTLYDGQSVRLLVSGPRAAQSGVYLNGSSDLVFSYTQQMAALVDQEVSKDRILMLGGGAFTLPRYLAEKYPSSKIEVVEIDERLIDIARKYFGYKDYGNVQVHSTDARAYLNTSKTKYDIIMLDVYSDSAIPFALTTQEYASELKKDLKPGGIILANIIGSDAPDCRPLLRSLHASFATVFSGYSLYPQSDRSLQTKQNIIFAYSDRGGGDGYTPDLSGGMTLTDNFAPVERLKLQCL